MNYDWLLPAILAAVAAIFLWRWRVCAELLDGHRRFNANADLELKALRDFKAAKDRQRQRDARLKAEKRAAAKTSGPAQAGKRGGKAASA